MSMSHATERLSNITEKCQLALAFRGHWCSFLGVVSIAVLQTPEEVGGADAVEGKDRSSYQHSCSIAAGEDGFLLQK